MAAKYTKVPVKIDGRLDDSAWKNAAVYTMHLSKDKLAGGQKLRENGQVRMAWDDNYFYLGIKFQDSDITATGDKDQIHHYQYGDLCELFLKPAGKDNYVELYVTPLNKKTSFYIPNQKQYGAPGSLDDYDCSLQVAAYIGKGTLNKRDDRDEWWSAEMAMPVKDLERLGEQVESGAQWRILVARYNYSRFFGEGNDEIEYSMTPGLSGTSYHLIKEYAVLKLEK
ncbi:MAG: carbohydrate-binding family 9-like protein [Planctomycetota bacterium]